MRFARSSELAVLDTKGQEFCQFGVVLVKTGQNIMLNTKCHARRNYTMLPLLVLMYEGLCAS
jgi:hypothetical protein